jgi:ABC-type glycerol-3-phosphate transport system substrate-binding protein
MKPRTRGILIAVLAIALGLVLVGTALASPQGEKKPAAVKNYVFQHRWTMEAQQTAVNAIIAEFNKANPDVQFSADPIASDKQEQLLYMQYAAGNQPLVAWVTQAQSSVLNARGLLANLKPYYTKYNWTARVPAGQIEMYTDKNGSVFSMPIEGGAYTMIHYSTKIFQDLGIPKPSRENPMSWSAFLAMCEKIKAAGISPITLGNRDEWTLQHLISFYTMEELPTKEANELWTKSDGPSVTDPKPLDGLIKLWTLSNKGYLAPGANALSDDEARMLIYTGKVAMYHIGEWWPFMVQGDKMQGKFESDFFPIPQLNPDVPYKLMGSAHGFTVAKTGDLDAAARFIEFFTSVENMKKLAKTGPAITIIGAKTPDVVPDPIALGYPALYKYPLVNTESNQDVLVQVRHIGSALIDAKNEAEVKAIAQKLQDAKVEILTKAESAAQK